MRKKILQLLISVFIIVFGTACQATGIKEQKKYPETKKVKTEDMKTLTKQQFYKVNKKKSAPGDGWELIYYNKDKILISNVTSLVILRKADSRFQIDKILDLKKYDLNHSQSEETTELLPSNNGEQILLYNSYNSDSKLLAEENDSLISWVVFTTAYDDTQILVSTDINENNMLSLKISSYNTSTKRIINLFRFT